MPNTIHQLYSFLLKTNLQNPSSLPSPLSTIQWTSLVSSSSCLHPFLLFRSMLRSRHAPPDSVTLLSVLAAAARLANLPFGSSAHLLFFKFGLPLTVKCSNAAVHMYSKCGRLAEARKVFDEMPTPNAVSWTVLLSAVLNLDGLSNGRKLFDRMPDKNEVSWTVMVGNYIEAGMPREALSLLSNMLFRDELAPRLTCVGLCFLVSSCSQAGDLTVGRWIHAHLAKSGLFFDVTVATALVDMYGKCGRIGSARVLFATMGYRNLVAWNAMLGGLSMHGLGNEALDLFARLVKVEKPDEITFVNVLSACSRCGLVEQGRKLFGDMRIVYGLRPKVEHYACMVDLLGRAGELEEAEGLIRQMEVAPNEVVLGSLLASCALHGKLELGRRLMRELVEIDPGNTEYNVLLSNLYSSHGRYSEADDLWRDVKRKHTRKGPGMSCIEVNGEVHRFSVGDKSHPQTQEVYAKLDEMVKWLRLAGYCPNGASHGGRVDYSYAENGDEREERVQALFYHSERLAVAFGLISTRAGVPLRVFKNLRICCDCHSVMKLVSDIYEREIIIRDRNRFHCFNKGKCSCSDYW